MNVKELAFTINIDSPIAVYVQIENLVKFAVASGRLAPDDRLPSVREMSLGLGVNPNTITKAFRDLELLGIVYTRRGVGVTITKDAPKLCKAATTAMITGHLVDAVAEGMAAGIKPAEIRKIVTETITAKTPPYQGSA